MDLDLPTEPETDSRPPPIFIVGCQRSGTTLLRLILDSHPNISCGPESRFLAALATVTGSEWERMRLFGFPKDYWHQQFARLFDTIQSDYARSRGRTRWADKTPRYALSLDFIDALFPDAQIVHVIRDGRDVVASHREHSGYLAAVKAVEKWPRYIESARAVGARLPPQRYMELRYEALVTDLEPTLRTMFDFLGEPWDDAVLAHEAAPHDVPDRYRRFSRARRAAAGEDGRGVYQSRVGAHRREIDPVLRLLIRARSGRMLRALGYR
jgi:hypothetical protein